MAFSGRLSNQDRWVDGYRNSILNLGTLTTKLLEKASELHDSSHFALFIFLPPLTVTSSTDSLSLACLSLLTSATLQRLAFHRDLAFFGPELYRRIVLADPKRKGSSSCAHLWRCLLGAELYMVSMSVRC